MKKLFIITLGAIGLGFGAIESAAATAKEIAFFEKNIRPLLVEHCYKCHSAKSDKVKGGLLLDSQAGWMNGGDSGEAIVPGKPEESLLMEAVSYEVEDMQMPPKYQMSDKEISLLKQWIKMGAPDPRTGEKKTYTRATIDIEAGRQFWAFQKPTSHSLPKVQNSDWPLDSLDRFILAEMESKSLTPVGDAVRSALIRRVSFDLTGLPPGVEEVEAFVNDPSDDDEALVKVVDRLLASRQFGERWGRHWLDVVRYAESMGRTRNWTFPMAWRYRDYVIDAFNDDKPYDQFVKEQLAGDLMDGEDDAERNERLIATGFLALGALDLNERNAAKFKMDSVDEQLDVTGRAFMAMTTGCARCHDHKFDPIPTTDYYAMAGIFRSTDLRTGYGNRKGGNRDYFEVDRLHVLAGKPGGLVAPAEEKRRDAVRRERMVERMAELNQEVKRLNRLSKAKGGRKSEAQIDRAELRQQLTQAKRDQNRLKSQLKGLEEGARVAGNMAMGVSDSDTPRDCRVNVRGDASNLGDSVPRGFLKVLSQGEETSIPKGQSGRLQLAEWIASKDHPLTARVMVNRVWHHLFGRGLVATVDNFGNSGQKPSHPELLDHLALRFMKDEWSTKRLIKSLVMSRTYRMSTAHHAGNHAIDPGNEGYWRMNLRRLEVEALRDAILSVSGQLDFAPVKGSPVMKIRVGEIGRRINPSRLPEQNHRSVYLPVLRNALPEMFEAFDFAEPSSVMGRRDVTTVSTQALFMMNNQFVMAEAKRLARVLIDRHSSDEEARIRLAFRRAFSRAPSSVEVKRALEFVNHFIDDEGKNELEAWAGWCQVLFASAEFRYVL